MSRDRDKVKTRALHDIMQMTGIDSLEDYIEQEVQLQLCGDSSEASIHLENLKTLWMISHTAMLALGIPSSRLDR